MSKKRPSFSIIVPTHNGADRLPSSLQSVVSQTYDNYELIVVCDACTDHSADIASGYGAKVINIDAHRDGLARNAGLDVANGDWILFLDDDDYFMHEYCFAQLADQVGKHDEDVLDFAFVWKGEGYKIPSKDECFVMVWCRAWRRSFIGDNRFDDSPYGSDKHFFQKMIQNNKDLKIHFWNTPIYYYNYLREGSLSWMEKKKTLLDIIVTHYDEPWELGKPFFDMLQMQRCADLSDIAVVIVQDGPEHALPWKDLLSEYTFKTTVVTIPHSGTGAARNAGIKNSSSDWIMFFNFDDHFADVCSLSLILKNLPTDEVNLIWCKIAHERKWYTGVTYINCVNDVNFGDTDGKLFRRKFLNDHSIRFAKNTLYYDSIFNTIVLSESEPWKIVHMTSDIYPVLKTFREDSLRHTIEALEKLRTGVFQRDCILMDEMKRRGHEFTYKRLIAKIIVYGFYTVCNSENVGKPAIYSQEFIDFYRKNKETFAEILHSSEIDVVMNEAETEVLNLVQTYYNEHKIELYFQNDNISLVEWLNYLDSCASGTPVTPVTALSQPEPAELPAQEPEKVIPIRKEAAPVQATREERIVVYCGTYDVYLNMVASCKSLLSNVAVDKVYFLIEDDEFPFEIPDIVQTINVKPLANQLFDEDGPNFDSAWTYMCMIRAAFPEMFPQYAKILSLDIDIVINDDVSDLWDYDLTDYYLAGVPERQRQKSTADPLYINFGVVLMNLAKLRKDNIQEPLIASLNKQKFGCPEQDAYNKICAGHILHLPAEYNYTTYSHITGDAIKERIIHYAGQKFWRHYSLVKKYSDQEWPAIMEKQRKLKGE